MLKLNFYDARMTLIVLLACFPLLLVSVVPHHSLPDVEPVRLSSSCIHSITHESPKGNFPPVIMLHGMTDSRKTWNNLYGVISLETGRMVCTLDLRNHGTSPWSDVFSFDILAVDVNHFMERRNISKAILIGHSMGGATAMKLALAEPEKVEMLIVEDFPPHKIAPEVDQAVLLLMTLMRESLKAIPEGSDLKSAKLAVRDYIRSKVPPELAEDTQNDEEANNIPIVFENGNYRWQTNLDVIIKSFENPDAVLSPFTGEYNGDTLFIYGTKSPLRVYDAKDEILKLFPKAEFYAVEGASHAIHSRYPEFLTAVLKHIKGHSLKKLNREL